jgi:hypothetical protein
MPEGAATTEVKLFGPLQLYVTPDVAELPVKVTLVLVQVIGPSLTAVILAGAVVFKVTGVLAEAVQPLDGSVTVTV